MDASAIHAHRTSRLRFSCARIAPESCCADTRQRQNPVHAASVPSRPGIDKGSINEIRWYGTRGMIDPRAPRLR